MNRGSTISRVYSLGLVLVLMLSITPKALLHELFAAHDDVIVCNDADLQGPCIHKQAFNCEQSDLAVPLPFIVSAPAEIEFPSRFITREDVHYSPFHFTNKIFVTAGRGPPAHV